MRAAKRGGAGMLGYLDFLFLGYSGRIGRLTYWVATFVLAGLQLAVICGLLFASHGTLAQLKSEPKAAGGDVFLHVLLPILIIAVLFLYPTYALATKRWHDRGKSGWWSLIGFVPVIGGLWMLIELGFLGPNEYVNEYGTR
jgi:uncharacterized membrane protein YhaH (DUF805 family)